MAKRLRAGDVIPEFRFDTPYHPQNSFYELLEGDRPVFLVFLQNFGHPLTRNYVMEYIKTAAALHSARLVCVVRTRPAVIAKAIPEGAMPYQLICDTEGVLYRFFAVPGEKNRLKCFSFKAMKILNEAKKQGFKSEPGQAWQLPLTLLVGPAGRVLLAHYGATLTDLPEDCMAMEELAADLLPTLPGEWLAAAPAAPVADSYSAAFAAAAPAEPAEDVLCAALAPAEPAEPAAEAPGASFDTGFDVPPEPAAGNGEEESFGASLAEFDIPAAPAAPAAPEVHPEAPSAPAVDLSALGFDAGK